LFIRHIPMIIGESISSYLTRISSFNGYSILQVLSELRISKLNYYKNYYSEQDERKLATLTRGIGEQIKEGNISKVIHLESEVFRKFVMHRYAKYCPVCLQTQGNGFHKMLWSIHPVTICIEHKAFLIEECNVCNRKVTMNSLLNNHCSCGVKFSNIKHQECKNELLLHSQIAIQSLVLKFKGLNKCHSIMDEVSFEEFIQLAFSSFHLFGDFNVFSLGESKYKSPFHNKKFEKQNNIKNAISFANVFWMYQNFPNNFYAVLNHFHKHKRDQSKYIQKNSFESILDNAKFSLIKSAYENFWLQKYDEGSIRVNFSVFKKNKILLEQRKNVTKEEVKQTIGWSYPKIEKLTENHNLESNQLPKGKSKRILVTKRSIQEVKREQNLFASQREAANILGLSKVAVEKLLFAKLLHLERSPSGQMQIKKEEIETLIRLCQGQSVVKSDELVGFKECLIKYSVNGISIVYLIRWILDKQITPYSLQNTKKICDLYFNHQDILSCLQNLKMKSEIEKGYYFSDVRKILKVGEKTLWQFVNHGILSPDQIETWKDGRKRYYFNKQKVDNFFNDHITISDASKRFDIPEQLIRTWLKKGRISNILNGVTNGYLLRTHDLIEKFNNGQLEKTGASKQ
jgi:hypothetical protein